MSDDGFPDPISALGDDEIDDMISDISEAVAVLLEGRPALVIAFSLIQVVADVIAGDAADDESAKVLTDRTAKMLADYVAQARREPLF